MIGIGNRIVNGDRIVNRDRIGYIVKNGRVIGNENGECKWGL